MLIKCTYCLKDLNKKPSKIFSNNFCDKNCESQYRSTGINTNCHTCNKSIYVRQSSKIKSNSGYNFCSKSCAVTFNNSFKTGEKHHGFNGGTSDYYYRKIAFNKYNNLCNRCGYNEYLEILQVHHKDHNRNNNNIDNLEILCPNCHQIEHFVFHNGTQDKSKVI